MSSDSNDVNETIGSNFDQSLARIAVGAYGDSQQVRQAMMNRVRDVVRKRNEGIPFDMVETEKDPDETDFESKYKDANLPELIEEMERDDKLSAHERKYLGVMLDAAATASEAEQLYQEAMEIVKKEPIYQNVLQYVNGVGPTLAAKLLHKFGYCGPVRVVDRESSEVVYDETFDGFDAAASEVKKAVQANRRARDDGDQGPYRIQGHARISHLWSYTGIVPGKSRKRGERLTYDPEAKTLAWLVADRMIMQGSRSKFKEHFYDPYKAKQMERLERAEEGVCIQCGGAEPIRETVGRQFLERFVDDIDENTDVSDDVCTDCFAQRFEPGEGGGVPTAPNSRGHADLRARRYLSQRFLKFYWWHTRDQLGLETPEEWVVTHGGHDKKTETFENPDYALREIKGPG